MTVILEYGNIHISICVIKQLPAAQTAVEECYIINVYEIFRFYNFTNTNR